MSNSSTLPYHALPVEVHPKDREVPMWEAGVTPVILLYTGQSVWPAASSVSDLKSNRLAGIKAFNRFQSVHALVTYIACES